MSFQLSIYLKLIDMGLFDFFKQKQAELPQENNNSEIPRDIFLEEREYEDIERKKDIGIHLVYGFLLEDFELRGYNDALTNPDESYKTDNLKLLAQDLDILIQKVDTYYQDRLKVINFHIASRGRAGLVDLVEELKTHQDILKDHMAKMVIINTDNKNKSGVTQRIMLSYQRGFMRGLSAITQSKLFN